MTHGGIFPYRKTEEILSDGLVECLVEKYDTSAFVEKVICLVQDRGRR